MEAVEIKSRDRRKRARSPFEESIVGSRTIVVVPATWPPLASILKRGADILLSSMALLCLWPVFAAIALCVRLTSRGPVLFRQERIGIGGRPFTMLKFRTMVPGADQQKRWLMAQNEVSGPVFKMRNDPRVTPVGRVLRKFSLDELPQLVNVLRGDMSLVGPRPALMQEIRQYRHWQLRRLSTRPGITCIWQVSGRSKIAFEDWMRMNIRYIEGWNLGLDVRLLARTIPAVVKRDGGY